MATAIKDPAKRSYNERHRDYMASKSAAARALDVPPLAMEAYARRTSLESDREAWMRYYLPAAFTLPFGQPVRDLIHAAGIAIDQRGRVARALPRGWGKTTILRAVQLHAALTGRSRFAVIVSKTGPDAEELLSGQYTWLCTPRLVEDYPEACYAFWKCQGSSQRLRVYSDARSGVPLQAQKRKHYLKLPDADLVLADGTSRPAPSSGAVIMAAGLTADGIRGMQRTGADGAVMRPDLALIDDPQTAESAKSPGQTRDRYKLITEDLAGLATGGNVLAMLASVTVMRRGDLATRLLDRQQSPDWRGGITGALTAFPANGDAWKCYDAERIAGLDAEDNGERARAYYMAHQAELDAGTGSTWPERKSPRHASAIQAAMDEFFKSSDFFWSELMNQPQAEDTTVYDLSPAIVMRRVNGRSRCEIDPHAVPGVFAFTDVNYSGLHWTLATFRPDMTCAIIAYGRTPETGFLVDRNATEGERRQRIAWGLGEWVRALAGLNLPYRAIGIDAGFEPSTVRAWIEGRRDPRFFASRGYASTKYRPDRNALQRWERCHLSQTEIAGRFIAFDADHYREQAQRGFLADVGAPTSTSIYGDDPRRHREYAEQICGETLAEKAAFQDGARIYRWTHRPGQPWDWLDSLTGCFVGAAIAGLVSGGIAIPVSQAPREMRKPKVAQEV